MPPNKTPMVRCLLQPHANTWLKRMPPKKQREKTDVLIRLTMHTEFSMTKSNINPKKSCRRPVQGSESSALQTEDKHLQAGHPG